MSETPADTSAPPPTTAGGLLRQARQAQGMHIAMLAAATKVPQRKLEALENDRFDELPDATFTRALAQTVCRALKIDPAPVMALLPRLPGQRLEQVGEGINAPFRERSAAAQRGSDWSLIGSPAVWAPLLLLLITAVIYFLPGGMVSLPGSGTPSAPVAAPSGTAAPVLPAAGTPASASALAQPPAPAASVVVETVHSAPAAPDDAASAAAPAVAPAAGALQFRVSAESWVEVLDARGQTLLSRLLLPGEAVGVDGATPIRLTIGNASATQVSFRGKPVELTGVSRDNVARMELK